MGLVLVLVAGATLVPAVVLVVVGVTLVRRRSAGSAARAGGVALAVAGAVLGLVGLAVVGTLVSQYG